MFPRPKYKYSFKGYFYIMFRYHFKPSLTSFFNEKQRDKASNGLPLSRPLYLDYSYHFSTLLYMYPTWSSMLPNPSKGYFKSGLIYRNC